MHMRCIRTSERRSEARMQRSTGAVNGSGVNGSSTAPLPGVVGVTLR